MWSESFTSFSERAEKYVAELEARNKVKAEEYDTRIMLAHHLEIERDKLRKRVEELEAAERDRDRLNVEVGALIRNSDRTEAKLANAERERDHANMVADAAAEKIKELEEQNRRLSSAWKQLRAGTIVSSAPGQYVNGPWVVTGYEYADLPHRPEEGYEDAKKGGA
jgi:chromosome segregation ATPase